MMFMESKNLYTTVRDVKNGGWNKPTGRELNGKTLVIRFRTDWKTSGRVATDLDHVLAYDVFEISDEVAAQYNVTKASQEEIIRTSDYISLHVPLLDYLPKSLR